MFKKNQVVVVNYKGLGPRLAAVRGVRKDGTLLVMMALYKRSSVFTDWVIDASEVVRVADVPFGVWQLLAWCLPKPAAADVMCQRQVQYDQAYPSYAAMRQCYEVAA